MKLTEEDVELLELLVKNKGNCVNLEGFHACEICLIELYLPHCDNDQVMEVAKRLLTDQAMEDVLNETK